MKWLWNKLKSVPILGWILVALAGILTFKFAGGDWLVRRRAKKAIKEEEKRLDEEKEVRDAEREDRRRAFHDRCPFDK